MSSTDVLIPACNASRYLAEAIAGVLAQTHPAARIIVVDDGSTDATGDVARSMGGCVEVMRQPHRGISGARNAALALSAAPFIAFLDADDRWLPGKLERQHALLAQCGESDFALCQVRCFASPELPEAERVALEARHEARGAAWLASALLIRRAAFDRVGFFAEDLRVGETIDWFDRARVAGLRGVVLEEMLVERRLHRHNTTRTQHDAGHGYLLAIKRHLDRLHAAANRSSDTC